MLNQFVLWCDVSDRARSKPRETFEGTRYCRAIRLNRLCRGRCEVLRLGIAVSLVTFFAAVYGPET